MDIETCCCGLVLAVSEWFGLVWFGFVWSLGRLFERHPNGKIFNE